MTTDFRALCAELLLALEGEGYAHWTHSPDEDDLVLRARAALAEPEPEGPTLRQLMMLADDMDMASVGDAAKYARAVLARWGSHQPAPNKPTVMQIIELTDEVEAVGLGQVDLVRAALARWGQPASQPIPVSERLPRPEDCDEQGRCWWFNDEDGASCSHWLPAHALPLPSNSSP